MNSYPEPLQQAIIATLAYFDMFDYPLTLLELDRWLYIPSNLIDIPANERLTTIRAMLHNDPDLARQIETSNGFYFFSGRKAIIKKRLERYVLAEQKFQKARQLITWLQAFPYVRFIGICNTLGFSNASAGSDIDLIIIAAAGHLWTTRFWTVSLAKIFGLRPTPEYSKDRFCFSFFLSDAHLDISSLRIAEEDIYLRYWLATVIPVYDQGDYYKRFQEENAWLRERLPNFREYQIIGRRRANHQRILSIIKRTLEGWPNNQSETFYQFIQKRIMPEKLQRLSREGIGVIINERMLKFHDHDRRHDFLRLWQEKRQIM